MWTGFLLVALNPYFLSWNVTVKTYAWVNLMMVLGLVASALAMHVLIRWLGLGVTAAAWAGAAYMVSAMSSMRARTSSVISVIGSVGVDSDGDGRVSPQEHQAHQRQRQQMRWGNAPDADP